VREQVPRKGRALFKHPIASATMALLHEQGYEAASVTEICIRARVSKDCLPGSLQKKLPLVLAVSEAYVEDFRERVGAAFEGEKYWPDTLRAAVYETLRWTDRYPDAAWWGVVGVIDIGEVARARRDGLFAWAARLIEAGREVAPDPDAVPTGAALHGVGAFVDALRRPLEGKTADDSVEAVPPMMYAAVRPYLGEEAARAELTIEPPPDLRTGRSSRS
jgi:AcrR family transcriptional regulator